MNPKTIKAYYASSNFGGFIKKEFGACSMQHAALAARCIGVMQQAALGVCILFEYLHATEQHFAWQKKWRHAVRSIAYASRGV